jgi:hypothetical protein
LVESFADTCRKPTVQAIIRFAWLYYKVRKKIVRDWKKLRIKELVSWGYAIDDIRKEVSKYYIIESEYFNQLLTDYAYSFIPESSCAVIEVKMRSEDEIEPQSYRIQIPTRVISAFRMKGRYENYTREEFEKDLVELFSAKFGGTDVTFEYFAEFEDPEQTNYLGTVKP